MRQLDAQNGGMNGIEACIPTEILVEILRLHTMNAQARQAIGQFRIIGSDHAAVTKGPEVLARIEAEAADSPEAAGPLALVFGTHCLSCVLNDGQTAALSHLPERFHFHALPEEMDRADGTCPAVDFAFHLKRIEIIRHGINVHKDGTCSHATHGTGRGKKSEWRHDHFVTSTNPERMESQQECIGSGGTTDSVTGTAIRRDFLLQGRNFRPQDHLPGSKDTQYRVVDLSLEFPILEVEITKRHPGSDRAGHALTP